MSDLDFPPDLSERGRLAAQTILDFAKSKGSTDTGGCRAFYSPAEWKDRHESYGTEGVLIVCHDGGCFYDLLPVSAESSMEIGDALSALGFTLEQCTAWYSAVYEDHA